MPNQDELNLHLSQQDTSLDSLRDRQTRIETSMESLTSTVRAMADTQQNQQNALSTLTSDVQSILTLLKTKDGRIDLKLIMSVVVPLGAFVVFFLTMYISPLKSQIDGNQLLNGQGIADLRRTLDEHLNSDGTAGTQKRFATYDVYVSELREQVKELNDRDRHRLEEDAAVGRAALRRGIIEPKLDPAFEVHK